MRVPVRVVDDDGVCRGQVDAESSGPGGEEEHELRGIGGWREGPNTHWQDKEGE